MKIIKKVAFTLCAPEAYVKSRQTRQVYKLFQNLLNNLSWFSKTVGERVPKIVKDFSGIFNLLASCLNFAFKILTNIKVKDSVPFTINLTLSTHLSICLPFNVLFFYFFISLFGLSKNWNNYILSCALIYFLLIAAKNLVKFFVIL